MYLIKLGESRLTEAVSHTHTERVCNFGNLVYQYYRIQLVIHRGKVQVITETGWIRVNTDSYSHKERFM